MEKRPRHDTSVIVEFIKQRNGEPFSFRDVVVATGISKTTIGYFLLRHFRNGSLTRIGSARTYRYVERLGIKIPTQKPKGALASAVWAILDERFPNWTSFDYVVRHVVSSSVFVNGRVLREGIKRIIYLWLRENFVEERGKGLSLYRRTVKITGRPPVVWRKK